MRREGEERCQASCWLAPAWLAQQGLQWAQNSRINGFNFFLLSSTYIGKLLTLQIVAQLVVTGFVSFGPAFEEIISDKRGDKKDWITGAAAGTITGGFYAGLVGGPFRGLQGATAGEAVGEAVVFGREQFHTWRLGKSVQRYQSKYGEAPAIIHPTTALLVESQVPPQKLAFPSLLPKSIKIFDEEIERRIVIRMDELRKEMQEGVATLDSNDRVK
ncbi:hypothetical protein PsorP6_017674 [Peronosclerospora sorghi]|uniref:Uncharacterized protein n=1 Tax=Peronosclerospora sorghi TaxID=230839 RepID=A0ACC0WNR0_9STRA|nr:hypothetical protein PsorP6_017674 [Peronosclerospora sorghi]